MHSSETEFWRQSKLKRRDISYNRCYQIFYICTMYFQGRRNMLNAAQLNTKAEKSVDEPPQNISSKNVLLVFDIKTWRNYILLSLDASDQRDSCGCASHRHFPIFIFPRLSLASIALQCKLLWTRSSPMDTQSAISYFSKKMFAMGTHWKRLFYCEWQIYPLQFNETTQNILWSGTWSVPTTYIFS